MKVGIIGAMEPEIVHLTQAMLDPVTLEVAGIVFISGQLSGQEVIITRSGIGKVSASIATSLLLERYQPDIVINTGSAGGFVDSLSIGDIVVASELRYHDVDVMAFGYEMGQMAGQPAAFYTDERLVNIAMEAVTNIDGINAMKGLICSGDSFIHSPERTQLIRQHFPSIAACEMEGAAIAQVCHQFKIPLVVVRSLSDNANNDSPVDFDAYLVTAGKNSAALVVEILSLL